MNKAEFKEYISDWKSIQARSAKISNDYYNSQIKNIKNNYTSKIKKQFSSINKLMGGIGRNAVNGLINGMRSKTSSLSGISKTLANSIIRNFKKSLKIKSPSRLLADEVGRYIPEGIAMGVENNSDTLMKALDDMDSEMVDRLQNAINLETGKLTANANIKGNSFLNTTTVNSHVVADVYMDRTKVGQAVTPIVAQTIRKAGA